MVKRLVIFFISLVTLLVSGSMMMYSIRSVGPDIVTSIESIEATNIPAESAGYSETEPEEISVMKRILNRDPSQDRPAASA